MVELKMLRQKIFVSFLLILFCLGLFVQIGLTQEGLEESTTYQISVDGDEPTAVPISP